MTVKTSAKIGVLLKTEDLAGQKYLLLAPYSALRKSQGKAMCRPSMDSHAIYFPKAKY
jgi:hypothetical protein